MLIALALLAMPVVHAVAPEQGSVPPPEQSVEPRSGASVATDSPVVPANVPVVSSPAPAPGETPDTFDAALGKAGDPLDQIEQEIEAQEYLPAIHDLQQRIDHIEDTSHSYDGRLVRPLTLLGDAQAGLGQYESALEQYRRAVHLSRVNLGLTNPEQVVIVYREANTFKALGDYQHANDREEYAYYVLNQAHDPKDEQLLPGIYHLADWYERTSNVFAARALYEQAEGILDAHHKLDTEEAIPALTGLAASYRMERFPPFYMADASQSTMATASVVPPSSITVNNFPEGEAALQRIVRIRQAQPEDDPVAVAKSVLDLADWYTLFDKPTRADPLYAHAWELMKGVKDFDVVGYFSQPELLYFPAPGNPTPPPVEKRGERNTGYVEVTFDVTDDGYVRDLTTVASEPRGLMDFRVRKSLRLARYRPVLVDGVAVATESHTYRHEFPYYPELQDQSQPAAASTDR